MLGESYLREVVPPSFDFHAMTAYAIVDAIRCERADDLLVGGARVKAVAFALGFSEASAFSRAYKRWTGRAPAALTSRTRPGS